MLFILSGVYEEIQGITKLRGCVLECCLKENCNVAFMTDDKCYHITCKSNELCVPSSKFNSDAADHLTLVLVKPTDDESWEEALRQQG